MTICAGLFILAAVAGAFIWTQPQLLRTLAARIMARAESIEAQKLAHMESLKHWSKELKAEIIKVDINLPGAPSDATGEAGR